MSVWISYQLIMWQFTIRSSFITAHIKCHHNDGTKEHRKTEQNLKKTEKRLSKYLQDFIFLLVSNKLRVKYMLKIDRCAQCGMRNKSSTSGSVFLGEHCGVTEDFFSFSIVNSQSLFNLLAGIMIKITLYGRINWVEAELVERLCFAIFSSFTVDFKNKFEMKNWFKKLFCGLLFRFVCLFEMKIDFFDDFCWFNLIKIVFSYENWVKIWFNIF